MNNPSLENDYVIVCKYAFEHLSCGIYGDLSIFSSISGKVPHVASFNPIRRHIARFSQKKKKKKGNVQEYIRTVLNHLYVDWIFFE